jgi:ribosomal protein L11
LKEVAAQYSEEAIETLVQVMRDPETSAAVKVQAADKLLDRSHGRPPVHIEPTNLNITSIPWDELREIRKQSMERALQRHREVVEGRYERLGISREYHSD